MASKNTMKLPTFLIVGVQKAGTTSIYNYLKQHPQIYMSPVKETDFLEQDWEKIAAETGKTYQKGIRTFQQYQELFEGVRDEIAIGEASPNYLFHYQSSADLISHYLPQAKLIVILRNPVERAYSDYLMHVRDAIGRKSLSEQIKYSAHKSFIIKKGFYTTPLQHYFDKFGREKIKIYLYDDLCQSPLEMMQDLYRYVGVDETFVPNLSYKAQVAQVPKVDAVNTILKTRNPVRSSFTAILKQILPLQTRQKIRQKLIELNSQDKQKNPLSQQDRQQLLEIYREDILKLQDLLHRDLSTWLKVE